MGRGSHYACSKLARSCLTLYLVGDGAAWVTGQTIFVDGGAVPRL